MIERNNAVKNKKMPFVLYIPILLVSAVLWFFIQRNVKKRDAGTKTAE